MFSLPVSSRMYAHIDCDCFFVSCEILRDPSIAEKYVCVGGDIIVTSSYKARALGITLGTPRWEAERMVPKGELLILPPDMHYYAQISGQLMSWLRGEVLSLDVFSVDEGWVDITGLAELKGMTYEQYAHWLQNQILRCIGVPVSIGIANTRLRSKILSEIKKPRGVCVAESDLAFWWHAGSLHFKNIPFVGVRSQQKLRGSMRGDSIIDFHRLGWERLYDGIGKNASGIWHEINGSDVYKLKDPDKHEKSIGATRSFNHHKTNCRKYVWQHMMMNFERAYRRLIQKNLEARMVGISFRIKDGSRYGDMFTFDTHTNQRSVWIEKVSKLFSQHFSEVHTYRGTGVFFYDLHPYLPKQYRLGEYQLAHQKESNIQLERAINRLNTKYGRGTVMHASNAHVDPTYMSEFHTDKNKDEKRIGGFVSIHVS